MNKLIGVTGLRRSGKDTIGAYIAERYGYKVIRFAEILKAMINTYLEYRGVSPKEREMMIDGASKELPSSAFEGKSCRYAMQTLGTEWGRDLIDKNIWVNATMDRAKNFEKVVISDVRFPNEAFAIKDQGGLIIRVTRPGATIDQHTSEAEMFLIEPDVELNNNALIHDLRCKVDEVMK